MKQPIPYAKLSKKKKREEDLLRRKTWGALSPVTRKPAASGIYRREKMKQRGFREDSGLLHFCMWGMCRTASEYVKQQSSVLLKDVKRMIKIILAF